jgi:hypothetical protein
LCWRFIFGAQGGAMGRIRRRSIGELLDIPSKMWYNISYFG